MNEPKHLVVFRAQHLQPAETIRAWCRGTGGGKDASHLGVLVVTGQRVAFYRKGWFGEVLETISLEKITSIERKTLLGHKTLRLHTSHDQLLFKTFENWSGALAAIEAGPEKRPA